jgi:hypothetical protein
MTNRSLTEAKFDPPAIIHDVTNPTDVPHRDIKIRWPTQTREYPTTGQVAVAPGVWLDAAVNGQSSGGWVDDHGVAEVFELGD